jgi:hypothetical protein
VALQEFHATGQSDVDFRHGKNGFVRRDDFKRTFGSLRFSPRPRGSKRVRKYTAEANIEYFVNERTFDKQTVGHGEYQPRMRTSVPNLLLCGSWIKIDTAVHDMEKAVTTGMQAANILLERAGCDEWDVRSLRPKTRAQRIFSRVAPRFLPVHPAVRRAV